MSTNPKKPCVRCGYRFGPKRPTQETSPLCQSCRLTMTKADIAKWVKV